MKKLNLALLTFFTLTAINTSAQVKTVPPPATNASSSERSQLPLAKYARERGLLKCGAAIELAERNLLNGSEYTFRAYHPPRSPAAADIGLFTAIVDSRKIGRNEPGSRATLNLTVSNSLRGANACTTMYEQTVYHNANCVQVISQMAPNGRQSGNPSLGSVLLEITDTLSLTVIPVGDSQCVTIVKEAAFDVPTPAR